MKLRESLLEMIQSSTFRNTGWSALGSVSNGVIGAVSSAILARFLGVEDFGTLVLILALLNLVTDLSDLGLNSSLIKFGAAGAGERDQSGFRKIASVVLRLKLILGGAVVVTALMLGPLLVGLFFDHVDPQIVWYFQLSLLGALLAVPASFFPALLQTAQQFRTYSLAMVSRYGSKLLFLLICVVMITEWTLDLMVWVEIGSIVVFLLAGFLLSPLRRFDLSEKDPSLQRQIFGFGKWIVLYQVISLLGGKVDIFFIGGIADSAALGLYGAAMKIAGVVSVTTYSYFSALLPEFSGITSVRILSERRRKSFPIVLMFVAAIGVLFLIADPLILMLFGEPYAGAASLLQVVCLGLALNVLGHPLSAVLFSQNRPEVFPVSSTVSIGVFAAANLLLIPVLGVMGAAVAFVLHSVALFIVTLFYYRRWKREITS